MSAAFKFDILAEWNNLGGMEVSPCVLHVNFLLRGSLCTKYESLSFWPKRTKSYCMLIVKYEYIKYYSLGYFIDTVRTVVINL